MLHGDFTYKKVRQKTEGRARKDKTTAVKYETIKYGAIKIYFLEKESIWPKAFRALGTVEKIRYF